MTSVCSLPEHAVCPGHSANKAFTDLRNGADSNLDLTYLPAGHTHISLSTTQGLITWTADCRSLRCAHVLHQQLSNLDYFVTTRVSKLDTWRSHCGYMVLGKDLSLVITQFLNLQVPSSMYPLGGTPKGPWTKAVRARACVCVCVWVGWCVQTNARTSNERMME